MLTLLDDLMAEEVPSGRKSGPRPRLQALGKAILMAGLLSVTHLAASPPHHAATAALHSS